MFCYVSLKFGVSTVGLILNNETWLVEGVWDTLRHNQVIYYIYVE
jgi:hypothetical protein